MEIEHLKILRILVADSNLSRAAERLHMTQSALSKRVQAIEAEVGTELFERRGPRGLKALPQAIELSQLAERIVTAWDSGVKRIQRAAAEPEHFVLVGPQLFLREIVLPWWNKASAEFPHLQLEVQVSPLGRVSLETLQAGGDAGILEHREELSDYVCRPIFTERWGIVRHPSVKKESLKDYEWGTNSPRNNPVEHWLVSRQKMPPPRYRFYWQDLTAVAIWVAENPGAASVLPWHSVVWLVKRNRLVFEPLGPDASSKLYLAYPKNNPHRRFLKALSQIEEHEDHALE
jgi:DNA-binding transcriptional LysR family regulator